MRSSPLPTYPLARALLIALATGLGQHLTLEVAQSLGRTLDGLVATTGVLAGALLGGLTLLGLCHASGLSPLLCPRRAPWKVHLLALLGSVLLLVTFAMLRLALTQLAAPKEWLVMVTSTPPVLLIFAFGLAAPALEEALFRGLLHEALCARLPVPLALVVGALLFASAHGPSDALSFAEPFAAGLYLGLLRARTGSALPGLLAHASGNLLVMGLVAWGAPHQLGVVLTAQLPQVPGILTTALVPCIPI